MLTFYRNWLALDKEEFRIMVLLADVGLFCGNLSDICRYLLLDPQTSQRTQLRQSLQKLHKLGLIEYQQSGQKHTASAIPGHGAIIIQRKWMLLIKNHKYSSANVAWEQVLKVYLWIAANDLPIVTNALIAKELNISITTITRAKRILDNEFEAIVRKKASEKIAENEFRTIGQRITATAWWKENS